MHQPKKKLEMKSCFLKNEWMHRLLFQVGIQNSTKQKAQAAIENPAIAVRFLKFVFVPDFLAHLRVKPGEKDRSIR
jgi:hypothetical protein